MDEHTSKKLQDEMSQNIAPDYHDNDVELTSASDTMSLENETDSRERKIELEDRLIEEGKTFSTQNNFGSDFDGDLPFEGIYLSTDIYNNMESKSGSKTKGNFVHQKPERHKSKYSQNINYIDTSKRTLPEDPVKLAREHAIKDIHKCGDGNINVNCDGKMQENSGNCDISLIGAGRTHGKQPDVSDLLILKLQGIGKLSQDATPSRNSQLLDSYNLFSKPFAPPVKHPPQKDYETTETSSCRTYSYCMPNDANQPNVDRLGDGKSDPASFENRGLILRSNENAGIKSSSLNMPRKSSSQDTKTNRGREEVILFRSGKGITKKESNAKESVYFGGTKSGKIRSTGKEIKGSVTNKHQSYKNARVSRSGSEIKRTNTAKQVNESTSQRKDRGNTKSEDSKTLHQRELKKVGTLESGTNDNVGAAQENAMDNNTNYIGKEPNIIDQQEAISSHDDNTTQQNTFYWSKESPTSSANSDNVSTIQQNTFDLSKERPTSNANSDNVSTLSSCKSSLNLIMSERTTATPNKYRAGFANEENGRRLPWMQAQPSVLPALESTIYYDEDYFKRFERQNLAEQRELKKHFRSRIADARKTLREARKKAQEQTVAKRFDDAMRKHKEMQQKRLMRKASDPPTPVASAPSKTSEAKQRFTKGVFAIVKESVDMREIQKAEAQLDRAKAAKKLKDKLKVQETMSRPTSIKAQIRKDRERMERYEVEYLITELKYLNMDEYATKLVEALEGKDELEGTLRHQLQQKRQLAIQMAKRQKMEEQARIKEEERKRKLEEKERLERERKEQEELELKRREEEALRQREKNLKLRELYNFTVLSNNKSRSFTYSYLPTLKNPPPEEKKKNLRLKNIKPRYLKHK